MVKLIVAVSVPSCLETAVSFPPAVFHRFFQPDTASEKFFIPRDYKDVQADSSFVDERQNV